MDSIQLWQPTLGESLFVTPELVGAPPYLQFAVDHVRWNKRTQENDPVALYIVSAAGFSEWYQSKIKQKWEAWES